MYLWSFVDLLYQGYTWDTNVNRAKLKSGPLTVEEDDRYECYQKGEFFTFDVPDEICVDELNADDLFEDESTKNSAQNDINAAFKCLYYSAFENSYSDGDYDCSDLSSEDKQNECYSACFGRRDPIFGILNDGDTKKQYTTRVCAAGEDSCSEGDIVDFTYIGLVFPLFPNLVLDIGGTFFDYQIPTYLPPLDERLGLDSIGKFKTFDQTLPVSDETAGEFVVEVFEEYMNCAVRDC